MYAASREKPPVPWKPNTVEDAELESIRAARAKAQEDEDSKKTKHEIK